MSPQSALRMAVSRSWARVARAVCRPIASQVRAWHWSQPSTSFPVLNVCSTRHLPACDGDEEPHRGRLVLRRPAQVKRQAARPGEQAADQQDVPRAGGGGQGPVRVPGALGPSARAPLEDRVLHRVRGLDHRAGGQGDAEVPRDDRDVGQACGLARPAQGAAAPVYLIEGCPPGWQAAFSRRSSWSSASCGLVLRSSPRGMPAARHRGRSASHRLGMNTSKSAQACPDVVT